MSLLAKRGVSRYGDAEKSAILQATMRRGLALRIICNSHDGLQWDASDVLFQARQERRAITWDQARRIGDGKDWRDVVR